MPIFSNSAPSVSHTKTGKRPMTKKPRFEVIGSSQVMETSDPAPAGESLDSVPDVTDLLNMWSGGGIVADGTQDFLKANGEDPARANDMINTPPMVNEFRTHPELEEAHASLWDIHSEATGHQQVPTEDQVVQQAQEGLQQSSTASDNMTQDLFHDYPFSLDMMMVSMAEVEGRSQTSANNIIPEHNQPQIHEDNNNNLEPAQPPAILPEPTWNPNIEMDIEDGAAEDAWGQNSFDKEDFLDTFNEVVNCNSNPLDSFINNNNPFDDIPEIISRPSGNTQDLLAYAVGINEIKPEKEIKKEPEEDQHNNGTPNLFYPVENVQIEVIEEEKPKVQKQKRTKHTGFIEKFVKKEKRKVGRPEVKAPITITEVPKTGKIDLSQDQLRSLKYRRMRDLNNEASRKCRKNRKSKAALAEVELEEEMRKNEDLRQRLSDMEKERDDLKNKLVNMGIFQPVN